MSKMGYSEQKLPDVWNDEMDFFICDCDARDVDPKVMMRTLKKLFPELRRCAVNLSSPPQCPGSSSHLKRVEASLSHESLTR